MPQSGLDASPALDAGIRPRCPPALMPGLDARTGIVPQSDALAGLDAQSGLDASPASMPHPALMPNPASCPIRRATVRLLLRRFYDQAAGSEYVLVRSAMTSTSNTASRSGPALFISQ